MQSSPNRGWSVLLGVVVLGIGFVLASAERAWAQPPGVGAWEQVGLPGEYVFKIDAPSTGALFAQLKYELQRSDDAGLTWRRISVPNVDLGARPDPHDHTRLYALVTLSGRTGRGAYQLSRSLDDGATWETIVNLPDADPRLILSTAAPGLMYVTEGPGVLHRSDDGGDTWTRLEAPLPPGPPPGSACSWVYEFLAHPTNPEQLFRTAQCRYEDGQDTSTERPYRTDRSDDRGQTWTTIGESQAGARGGAVSPFLLTHLVGSAAFPRVVYRHNAAARPFHSYVLPTLSATLERSDDGGATWTTIRNGSDGQPERINEVAIDPTRPERIFISRYVIMNDRYEHRKLFMSVDGGRTWADLGFPSGEADNHLAVGFDGRYLFVASSSGVYRAQLPD